MNETDIKKCIKHGYAWSSCGDKPDKTPTKDYTRSQLKTFEGLHATKSEAQLAIAMRSEDAPDNDHAEVKCDMPETLMLNGKLHKRLAEGEPREIGDVPVDGSQTNRFGSVYYRPIAETPEQRDARIKALVDGYITKGGPITKEQLTDEVFTWLQAQSANYFGSRCQGSTNGLPSWRCLAHPTFRFDGGMRWPSKRMVEERLVFWNRPDAEHAKWLDDMQSQTTPITAEQAKMLREGDSWYYYNPVIKSISECVKLIAINADQSFGRYFTRAAAQAALDKRQAAKQEAKPEMKPTVTPVEQHECSSFSEMNEETITPTAMNTTYGNKYHRTIKGVTEGSAVVDVYCVLEAFNVTCPARQHAIKKLLCAGLRGKGDSIQDLSEAMESVSRAIVLEKQRKE